MLNVGTPELLVILLVALLVLGPTKLPDAARQVGRAVGELRRLSSGFQAELRDAMQEPVPSKREPVPGEGAAATAPDGGSDGEPAGPRPHDGPATGGPRGDAPPGGADEAPPA